MRVGTHCLLLLAVLIAGARAIAQEPVYHPSKIPGGDYPVSYRAWVENMSLHDNYRLEFLAEDEPLAAYVEGLVKSPPTNSQDLQLFQSIYSRRRETTRLSRRGRLERYEIKQERATPDLSASDANHRFPALSETENYTEIHGDGKYFYYSELRKSGTIRTEWPDRKVTPVDQIAPPPAEAAELIAVSDSGLVLDFKTSENDMYRYHLDPEQGMMPVKVEYFDILEDGKLFLYRFFTVEEYELTPGGVYLPRASTLHDFATADAQGVVTVGVTGHRRLVRYEDNVDIPDSEFTFEFPEGAHVKDRILELSYVVGPGASDEVTGDSGKEFAIGAVDSVPPRAQAARDAAEAAHITAPLEKGPSRGDAVSTRGLVGGGLVIALVGALGILYLVKKKGGLGSSGGS